MVDKKVVKSAGEHWVCSVLARFNWAAALTRDGVERTDILAVHPEGGQISIQVKTISPSPKPRFPLGEKGCLPSVSESEWYILVLLSELDDFLDSYSDIKIEEYLLWLEVPGGISWRHSGFTPQEAAKWSEKGFSPKMATRWRDAGVNSPVTAKRRQDAGLNP